MKTFANSLLLILTFIFITYVSAQNPIRIVSNAPNLQYHADVDGNYIVYWGNQDGSHHIYLYKISDSSTIKISTDDNSGKRYPKISGNYVVWSDNRNGDYDIFIYDINNPQLGNRQLITRSYDQDVWDFDGTKLLIMDYQGDFPNYNFRLICYDISDSTETLIKEDPYDVINSASISGHFVVYDYDGDIYFHNLFTQKTEIICDDPAEQRNPTIDGRTIVWEDNRNGDWDLYGCTLWYWQTGAHLKDWPLTFLAIERYKSTRSDQMNPHLKNKMLVFTDNEDGNDEIYLLNYKYSSIYRLNGTVTKISNSNYDDCNPITDGDKIVWWDDKDPNPNTISNSDVYLWQRPPGADLAITINTNNTKVQVDEFITFNITVTNYGPLSASNVVVKDSISEKIQILYASSPSGNVTIDNNVVTFTTTNLEPDTSVEITIIGKAISSGKATIYGTVTGVEPDYIPQNNNAKITIKIYNVRTSQLSVSNFGDIPRIKVDKNGFIHIISSQTFPVLLTYITNKTGKWTEEILNNSQGDLFLTGADLDVDEQGKAHIVYIISPYGTLDPRKTMYYTNNVSGEWTTTMPLGPASGPMYKPNIKIDKNNHVHICYITDFWSSGLVQYFNNKTGDWSSPETLSMAYNSISMDVDTSGYAHLVTYNINAGPIYITNSPNGVWQQPELVEQGWIGGQKEMMSLDIAVDKSKNVHVSYVGKYINNEDYKYAVRINGNWQNYFVDECGYMGGYNCITVDKNNTPYIMYVSPNNNNLYFAKKEGDIFNRYLIETNFSDYTIDRFDIDVDPSNNIHIVYYYDSKLYYGTNAAYTVNYGGGDENSGGYFFANSTTGGSGAPSQPTYNWVDPVSSGHNVITNWTEGNADDGYFGPIDLPFLFSFYSFIYDKIYINSNGYLSFTNGYSETASDISIPFIDEPNGILAACAMDLNLDTNLHPESKIYYGGDANKFIITYYHAYAKISPNDYITFQIILYPNGNILYQYNNLESTSPLPDAIANDALIGIENETGTKGICYRNNGAGGPIFSSPLAIMFGLNTLTLPVNENPKQIPSNFVLHQNYPNPFNPNTTIKFEIPKTTHVTLKIYNILGQEVAELVNEEKKPGVYNVNWNASGFPSGTYFYRLKTTDFTYTKKIILLR
ncbi:MAG: hypothetical protein IGBAC_1575 [Ignavibacteriae bacterium]|nr:MAG: hypothetical protein IGBAC_1575 [Ignavibacteriota bacterium]